MLMWETDLVQARSGRARLPRSYISSQGGIGTGGGAPPRSSCSERRMFLLRMWSEPLLLCHLHSGIPAALSRYSLAWEPPPLSLSATRGRTKTHRNQSGVKLTPSNELFSEVRLSQVLGAASAKGVWFTSPSLAMHPGTNGEGCQDEPGAENTSNPGKTDTSTSVYSCTTPETRARPAMSDAILFSTMPPHPTTKRKSGERLLLPAVYFLLIRFIVVVLHLSPAVLIETGN
ncbi:unnamed protein product [Pleuronectes platessa]|uniref:Uncharacterized protein n=1 Tax=Pleuronectes platessa TaxID=8262 RepID=A0A9N7VRP4_PLEPL|nr:unnamed protein product [Pleuronectes platessa]